MSEEVWHKVPSVQYLWASSIGRICSESYQSQMPNGGYKINQLRPTFGSKENCSQNYSRNIVVFRRRTYKVASLVAEAFLGPRPVGYDVSHRDEDSSNNNVNNLLYETRKKNLNRPKIKSYHRKVCREKMTA